MTNDELIAELEKLHHRMDSSWYNVMEFLNEADTKTGGSLKMQVSDTYYEAEDVGTQLEQLKTLSDEYKAG